jgi:hypothetical protein
MVDAKVNREFCTCYICFADVTYECCKRFFKIFHLFQTYVCKRFYLDVVYVSHICCKSMFQMFYLFQSYVAVSIFMLQVVSVLSKKLNMLQWLYTYVVIICFKYFSYFRSTLQVFYLDVAYVAVTIHIC